MQRVNLTTALGAALVNTLYVLDEPSTGLHARDGARLFEVLHRLRDHGNTVVVVEHDTDVMRAADEVIDIGPAAGEGGGDLVFQEALQSWRGSHGKVSQRAFYQVLTTRCICPMGEGSLKVAEDIWCGREQSSDIDVALST